MALMAELMTGDTIDRRMSGGRERGAARLPRRRGPVAWDRMRGGGNAVGLLVVLIALCVILSIVSPFFLTANNLLNIGRAVSIVGIVAVGETIVIISGGFDLSVGSSMAAAGMTRGLPPRCGRRHLPIASVARPAGRRCSSAS